MYFTKNRLMCSGCPCFHLKINRINVRIKIKKQKTRSWSHGEIAMGIITVNQENIFH